MTKTITLFVSGFVCFLLGIILATLGTNTWIMIGTILAIGGGSLMGGCMYFSLKDE